MKRSPIKKPRKRLNKYSKRDIPKLERKLWPLFSRFIKNRDAVMQGGRCITCDKPCWGYNANCGHFISRGHNSTKYDETNNNLQCAYCNAWKFGDQYNYGIQIDKKWGKGTAKELYLKSKEFHQFTIVELQELIKKYK